MYSENLLYEMDHHHTSVQVLNIGVEHLSQEEQDLQLHELPTNTASQDSLEQSRPRRKLCQRGYCKLMMFCGVLLVGLGVVVGLLINNYSKKQPDQSANAQSQPSAVVARNSVLTGPDTQGYIKYIIDVKESSCQGGDCRLCKWAINAPVKPVIHHDGSDCPKATKSHAGYRNCTAYPSLGCIGKCMDCNGTCMNYSSMVRYLGEDSPCTEDKEIIECCTLLHMRPDDYCLNGGKLLCEDKNNQPYCSCPKGWIGSRCGSRMTENMTCKCFKTDIKWNSFCGENDMYSCTDDDRPENWIECRLNIEGSKFSRCVCEKSEVHHSTESLPECSSVEISHPGVTSAHGPYNSGITKEPWFIGMIVALGGIVGLGLCIFTVWLCRNRQCRKKLKETWYNSGGQNGTDKVNERSTQVPERQTTSSSMGTSYSTGENKVRNLDSIRILVRV
ncbi:uncharacterized protein LOC127874001 isoform X6 [Dreissena polymorpha]|uniref:uncharacterized protein LOC127874001 isoform X6 n=1 Tax=Dreissena polymorpha TaxID=45954 RepID=UPI0022656E7F|nr:uncharacterized protein LOC127874001 isoform X6 [Dreissena polymorpha]